MGKAVVLELEVNDDEGKRKAMKAVANLPGTDLIRISIDMKKLTVSIDPVDKSARRCTKESEKKEPKKELKEKKEPTKKEPKKEEPKKEPKKELKEEPKKKEPKKEEPKKKEPKKKELK